MNELVLRVSGNALDLSPDGKSELPVEVRHIVEPLLCYRKLIFLRGQAAYDTQGLKRTVRTEMRKLYDYDKYGRLVCGAGFTDRLKEVLAAAGYSVRVEDLNQPHPRKHRFDEDWDAVVNGFIFRPRQEEALTKLASHPRGIIAAPVGFGKTKLIEAVCLLYPKARILITTKRKDVMEGIRSSLTSTLPNVGVITAGKVKPARVTVATSKSLHKVDPDDVDILIADEGHELVADTYAAELARFKYSRMYTFTATPTGRSDNADLRLQSLFGSILFAMSYQEAVQLGLVVPIRVRWCDVLISPNPAEGLTETNKQRWGIWRNQARNQIIADVARTFPDEDQVLIMVTTFEHAAFLKGVLPEFELCYAERDDTDLDKYVKWGLLPEGEPRMTPRRRKQLREDFAARKIRKVIATDVWSTGVSFNSLSVLIRADARSPEILDYQIPGRVCRINPETGKQEGLVVDLLDQFDGNFRNGARTRRRHYEFHGWIQDMPKLGRRDLIPNA